MLKKEMNFYWSGSKMSWLRFLTLKSFRQLNTNWTINLWYDNYGTPEKQWTTNEEQDFFKYTGPDFYGNLKQLHICICEWKSSLLLDLTKITPSQRSNFFKWEILSKGGFYSDMDIFYTHSIEPFFNMMQDFSCGLTFGRGVFSIGFMFAGESGGIFKAIQDNAVKRFEVDQYQGAGVIPIYTRWANLEQMQNDFLNISIFNIPMDWLYYYDSFQVDKIFNENNWQNILKHEKIIGIHWYAGHPLAQAANNRGSDMESCTLSEAIKECLFLA